MTDCYEYIGDPTGTDLDRTKYRVVTSGVDHVELERVDSPDRQLITKEEFQAHKRLGTLAPLD